LVADGRAGVGGSGHVNGELAKEFSGSVEDLNAAVAAGSDVNVIVRVPRDTMRDVELALLRARLAQGHQPVALLVYVGDTRIYVAVADVRVPGRVPGHVGDLAKHAVHWR